MLFPLILEVKEGLFLLLPRPIKQFLPLQSQRQPGLPSKPHCDGRCPAGTTSLDLCVCALQEGREKVRSLVASMLACVCYGQPLFAGRECMHRKLRMEVCVCACVYMCVHVCVHVTVCVCTCVCTCDCMCVYMCVCM